MSGEAAGQGAIAEDRQLVERLREWNGGYARGPHHALAHEAADRLAARLDDAEERDTLREALERVRWWLDAENEPNIETGWVKANAIIDSALARLPAAAAPREASEE